MSLLLPIRKVRNILHQLRNNCFSPIVHAVAHNSCPKKRFRIPSALIYLVRFVLFSTTNKSVQLLHGAQTRTTSPASHCMILETVKVFPQYNTRHVVAFTVSVIWAVKVLSEFTSFFIILSTCAVVFSAMY